ncbi:MAG: hypothetical protein ACPGYY_05100 [Bacteroidia bacterium]
MIETLTQKIGSAVLLSLAILVSYWFILGGGEVSFLLKLVILLGEGLLLNYLCFRYGILGQQTNLPVVLFAILSVLIVPDLSYGDLTYGLVWLGAFFFAFESSEYPSKRTSSMIYIGVLLGSAQAINNISILLIIPVFVLFLQTGSRFGKSYILSLLYFFMVVLAYIGVLYVMEIEIVSSRLFPSLTFDYSAFDTILTKLFLPFVILSILVHSMSMGSYRFRFPNKSKRFNFTMLIQLSIALLLLLITAQVDLFIYSIMASTVLLSFAFAYKKESVFVNAAFASLLCIALASLYLYKILIL